MSARQRQPAHFQHVAYSQKIKQFLTHFKTTPCLNPNPHQPELCTEYHSEADRRRNPYKDESFGYLPSQLCGCRQEDCDKCHNMYELLYHPLKYKTSKCYNYPCYGFICYYFHDQEADLLVKYQFFRFDLDTFKTELCPHRQQLSNMHELASCHYYHNQSDRRRNPKKVTYYHVQCSKKQCKDEECHYAHNKIEQLYHPSRYKTKYCQSYINKKSCQYSEYCSFAHSNNEIKIELLHEMEKNQAFYDYKYKTVWCPYTNQHDRANCPYAHNFQDYRRDPKKKYYTPETCPNWTKGQIKSIEDSGCPLRMDCPKSHGWLQKKYHPDRKKWESGQAQNIGSEHSDKPGSSKTDSKHEKQGFFVLGAPFFKRDDKIQRSQSEAKNTKTKEGLKQKRSDKQKWFNFSFFLPDQQTFSTQNNENDFCKTAVEALWISDDQEEQENLEKKDSRHKCSSPLVKIKISKKLRSEYSKSLKQLLVRAGLEEKISNIKINQVKLLNLSKQDLEQFGLNSQEQQLLIDAIKEYSKTHSQGMMEYTASMVKIFKTKALLDTLNKLKDRGVSQSLLEALSSSSIEELSFLEEKQKSSLPKILEEYADNRQFRELNSLIEKQTCLKQAKPRPRRNFGWHRFKT